jgi:phosphate-selective porin OprO/OprP
MTQRKFAVRAALLAGAATVVLSNSVFAQDDTAAVGTPKKHHHQASSTTPADRLDLLEKRVEQQADAIERQADEIKTLKAQLNQTQSPASSQVTPTQFAALQDKVDEQAAVTKERAVVAFTPQTPFQHTKTQATISSSDGKWTLSPVLMVQGDWASYSKGQPLSTAGTDNLKSSGENIRRARIGFQGNLDGDFGYAFIYDFGGSNGDETYQGYAAANSLQTSNNGAKTTTPYTASTGAGTGPHIYSAWISYKGILDPFTFKVGVLSTPANLGDMTQSDDLLFSERPTPAQLSRGLDADEGRESAGFIGNGRFWNASLFFTGDTYGKGALVAPATTYGGGQEAVVGRFAIVPWQDPDTNFNVHLGANFGYVVHPQESTNTQNPGFTSYGITFSDRPELRVDNVTFLNTGAIDAKSAHSAGLEAALSYGPLLIQGENFWYGITRNNPGTAAQSSGITNPNFSGWYVEGSWVLTGEPHPYNIANASFTRPSPANPFHPSTGDWGAWELAARYSRTDLDYDIHSTAHYTYTEAGTGGNTLAISDAVFGGLQNIASVGINFYPNDFLRFMFDFQNVQLRDIGALNNNGSYKTFEVRTQVSL